MTGRPIHPTLWQRHHYGGVYYPWHLMKTATWTRCGKELSLARVEFHPGDDRPPLGKICRSCLAHAERRNENT